MPNVNEADNLRVNALLGQPRPPLDASVQSPSDLAKLIARWEQTEACPVICAKREDGFDHSWLGIDVRTFLHGEQSAGRLSMHSVLLPPGAGLPAHYHEDRETFIIVVEGTPELGIGHLVEQSAQFSFGYAPTRTRVSFRNLSASQVWLNLVYFKAGMDCAFDAAHRHWLENYDDDISAYTRIFSRYGVHFDDAPLENDSKTNGPFQSVDFDIAEEGDLQRLRELLYNCPARPKLVHTSHAEVATDGPDPGFRKRILAGDESGGVAMLNFVSRIPAAPKHYQPTEEEMFFIMDGSLAMTCGNASVVLERGAMAFAPRNCTHAFGPPAPGVDHKFITLNAPGGHEHAMAALRARQKVGMTDQEFRELTTAGGFVIQ